MGSRKIDFDPQHAQRFLGAAVAAYHEALALAVSELARLKGTEDLSWFDELREKAVRSAKGTITEQIPVELEARALRFGFEVIDAEFESLRVQIVKDQ